MQYAVCTSQLFVYISGKMNLAVYRLWSFFGDPRWKHQDQLGLLTGNYMFFHFQLKILMLYKNVSHHASSTKVPFVRSAIRISNSSCKFDWDNQCSLAFHISKFCLNTCKIPNAIKWVKSHTLFFSPTEISVWRSVVCGREFLWSGKKLSHFVLLQGI